MAAGLCVAPLLLPSADPRSPKPALAIPETDSIESILRRLGYRPLLLHMDVRPPNILAAAGSIRAIIDWSNSLIGDPALEFARIAEW